MADSLTRRLLWLALGLLLAAVACTKKDEMTPLTTITLDQKSGATSATVRMRCEWGGFKVTSVGKYSVMTVMLQGSDTPDDPNARWSEIETIVNPDQKTEILPIRMSSPNWAFRAKMDSYVAGQAQVEFYEKCPTPVPVTPAEKPRGDK